MEDQMLNLLHHFHLSNISYNLTIPDFFNIRIVVKATTATNQLMVS